MAVAPTGAIFKTLEFDGESSETYGVYISGEAVFNAPERDVDMITIPGRNGTFALDNGRFENIEVTYPAGIFADNETDFAQAISDFRNFLCSKKGYCRLTDDYNPDEYRMAIYKSGLEVSPAQLKAGEFEITFECKPQRFLTSGETAVTVTSGNTITNPTLFPSNPLIEFTGYGDISLGSEVITVENIPLGRISIINTKQEQVTNTTKFNIVTYVISDIGKKLNSGDPITVSGVSGAFVYNSVRSGYSLTTASITATINASGNINGKGRGISIKLDDCFFTYGTSSSFTGTLSVKQEYTHNGSSYSENLVYTLRVSCNNTGITVNIEVDTLAAPFSNGIASTKTTTLPTVWADSSKTTLTNPCFIDLDIGEAWSNNDGAITNLNNIVQLPAKLPQFQAGVTTITYDNTFTSMNITPRWWKI